MRIENEPNFGRRAVADPHVGIFWLVIDDGQAVLVADGVPIGEAEPYGDCLTHPRGHYEMWEKWRRAGSSWLKRQGLPLAICRTEYESHPRGRIVYEMPNDLFVIYADRRLQRPEVVDRIKQAFGLGGARYSLRSDGHYR